MARNDGNQNAEQNPFQPEPSWTYWVRARLLAPFSRIRQHLKQKRVSPLAFSRKKPDSKIEMHGFLRQYCDDLVQAAHRSELNPLIGRDQELTELARILGRKTKNNPILVGEAGVGKTAIIEGLAQRIAKKELTPWFHNKLILRLDLPLLIAGTKYRGEFENRIKRLIDVVESQEDVILFIDEVHMIIGAGSSEGSLDAANILKPALARGRLRCIAATTAQEYQKHIARDKALARRFQPIRIQEPGRAEVVRIMNGIKSEFEHYHQVKISDKTIETAIELADRYLPDRTMPDKVIDLMDEAASSLKIRAVGLRRPRSVSPKIIHDVISSWTHIPLQELRRREKSNLLRLESQLRKKIVGQNEAISQVARAIRRRRIGIGAGKRPSGVFLFIGPTGVGKTALAQTLAEVLFGSVQQLIRLDMSEFTEAHSSAKLIGAPPGYVGFGEGGVLTHAVRTKPYSVILLDEIEKAHPSIFNLLLQLFDEGRLTDSQGETTDFRNTIIIMTSNLIDDPEKGSSGIGFKKSETGATNSLKKQIFNKLSHYFQQELLNRLDDVVLFKSLSQHSLQQIVKMHIQHLNDDLALQGVTIEMTSGALASIVKKIDEDAYDGARALRRVIRNYVEDDITELILSSKIKHGDVIRVGISHGRVVLKNKAD